MTEPSYCDTVGPDSSYVAQGYCAFRSSVTEPASEAIQGAFRSSADVAGSMAAGAAQVAREVADGVPKKPWSLLSLDATGVLAATAIAVGGVVLVDQLALGGAGTAYLARSVRGRR